MQCPLGTGRVSPQSPCVEVLIPDVTAFGEGALQR